MCTLNTHTHTTRYCLNFYGKETPPNPECLSVTPTNMGTQATYEYHRYWQQTHYPQAHHENPTGTDSRKPCCTVPSRSSQRDSCQIPQWCNTCVPSTEYMICTDCFQPHRLNPKHMRHKPVNSSTLRTPNVLLNYLRTNANTRNTHSSNITKLFKDYTPEETQRRTLSLLHTRTPQIHTSTQPRNAHLTLTSIYMLQKTSTAHISIHRTIHTKLPLASRHSETLLGPE